MHFFLLTEKINNTDPCKEKTLRSPVFHQSRDYGVNTQLYKTPFVCLCRLWRCLPCFSLSLVLFLSNKKSLYFCNSFKLELRVKIRVELKEICIYAWALLYSLSDQDLGIYMSFWLFRKAFLIKTHC